MHFPLFRPYFAVKFMKKNTAPHHTSKASSYKIFDIGLKTPRLGKQTAWVTYNTYVLITKNRIFLTILSLSRCWGPYIICEGFTAYHNTSRESSYNNLT